MSRNPSPCDAWANRPSNIPNGVDPKKDRRFRHLHYTTSISSHSFHAVRALLRTYKVYPERLVEGRVCRPDGLVAEGAVITQTAWVAGIKLRSAVRVTSVRDEERTYEFTYETLEGHPEQGVIQFGLKRTTPASAMFSIEAWSRPGNWLSRLARPIALALQRRANREALRAIAARAQDVQPRE